MAFNGTINSGNDLGMKNRLINGAMMIDQRYNGTSYTAATGGLRFGADRWLIYPTGANVTGQQVTGTNTGTSKAFKITGATGNTLVNFEQRIESVNCVDLASASVAFRFKIYCSTAITGANFYGITAGSTDNYGTIGSPISVPLTLNSGLNIITGTGTLNSTATNGVAVGIGFTSGIGNGVSVEISEFQFEKGSVATPFEYRSHGLEQTLCERYYQSSFNTGNTPGVSTSATDSVHMMTWSDGNGMGPVFRTTMRSAPTVALRSQGGTTAGYVNSFGVDRVASAINIGTKQVSYLNVTAGSATNYIRYTWTADGEIY